MADFFWFGAVKVGWGMNGPTGGIDNDFIIFHVVAPLVHLFQLSYLGCVCLFFYGIAGVVFPVESCMCYS